jgi:hypothetical protein
LDQVKWSLMIGSSDGAPTDERFDVATDLILALITLISFYLLIKPI